MKSFLYFYGSPTWNRTKINGFGDRYTNRCAMELGTELASSSVIFVETITN